jgi:hypothetical protein
MPRTKSAAVAVSIAAHVAAVSPGYYETVDLDFASFLVSTAALALVRIDPRERYSMFVFADPERKGRQLFIDWNTKDVQTSARLLLETRATLLNRVRGSR